MLAVEQARSLAFATDVDSTKFLQTVAHKLHQAIPEMKGRSSHARSARIAPLSFSTATGDYTQNPRSQGAMSATAIVRWSAASSVVRLPRFRFW